jgi:hypothetical protein
LSANLIWYIMKYSRTGSGGWPRKLSAILLSAVMLVTGLALAADNSIYIDQAGDNATVTVNQDGSANVVRGLPGAGTGNTTPASIMGDGTQVSVSQIGSGNTVKLAVANTTGTTIVNYALTNSMNSNAIIDIGSAQTPGNSNTINITQDGNAATANVMSRGAGNTATIDTSGGANNSATIGMVGDNITGSITTTLGAGNNISLDLQSPGGSAAVTAGGATNTVTVQQTGGGSGHQAVVQLLGSSNTVGIQQQGSLGDNIANINSAGSGNTFSIQQNNR